MKQSDKKKTKTASHQKKVLIKKGNWCGSNQLPIFVMLLLLVSCVKDDLYNTPHPDKGAVKVTTDWTDRSSDATLPDSYILRIGAQEQTVSGETNAFDALFPPGKQDLLVYHQAEGITISGTTATVNTLPDGMLEPAPGYLFSASGTLEVMKDDTLHLTVPMKQHIRRLALTLKLNPGDEQRIGSTAATLTGIASAVDLTTGILIATGGKTTVPAFALGTDADALDIRSSGQPVLSATLHLIGVATGERQLLTLEITLANGTVQTVTTDLTEALKNFGTGGSMESLALDATLELPAEAGISATITSWNVVDNGDIKVN
ncbi:FimB/Mfa2 family fimbrial subunit [Bacteroides uniformis]|uniref:FimB/Mfa2 family fimbrial subunit n=1 Tax=Bacteroides uniformis TaxID=820 RepID=A0AAW6GX94_BACUN|nr:FimB/Mfa2 family fimbrial subunit [Bacteroides uniformis]MDC1882091.1 FimB/Mfa2 family fimbrial subunit [Bacteroides uniformis]MDC1886034.1 FimB/Mfa2 family fimbrial subunit [Bacteroides uniformis]